ncbi:MAG: nucleotidyltransferase domain-containing protein [Chloroflexi bacterium]|nr:nucleotidyltransferase domain-containing protein [Chloroflexota bacterium]
MKEIPKAQLDIVMQRLVNEFQPERVILFGSHAWGTPNEDSDLDLLVIVPQSNERPSRRAARAYRCLRGLTIPAEILVKTRAEVERFQGVRASLESEILERGRVLYG